MKHSMAIKKREEEKTLHLLEKFPALKTVLCFPSTFKMYSLLLEGIHIQG